MIQIPVFQSSSSNFKQRIELESQLVEILIQYNIRSGYFHLSIQPEVDSPLYGLKIVPNFPILRQSINAISFEGDFLIVKDNDDVGDEITYDNLGAGWNLYYITADERDQWEVDNGL